MVINRLALIEDCGRGRPRSQAGGLSFELQVWLIEWGAAWFGLETQVSNLRYCWSQFGGAEGVALAQVSGFHSFAEPARALRGGAVGERVGDGVTLRLTL